MLNLCVASLGKVVGKINQRHPTNHKVTKLDNSFVFTLCMIKMYSYYITEENKFIFEHFS